MVDDSQWARKQQNCTQYWEK